jgi:hypothetical protein
MERLQNHNGWRQKGRLSDTLRARWCKRSGTLPQDGRNFLVRGAQDGINFLIHSAQDGINFLVHSVQDGINFLIHSVQDGINFLIHSVQDGINSLIHSVQDGINFLVHCAQNGIHPLLQSAQDCTNFLVYNAPDVCTPNYVDIFMFIRVTRQTLRPHLPLPRWHEACHHLRAVLPVGLIVYFFIMPIANRSSAVQSKVSSLSAAACDEWPHNTELPPWMGTTQQHLQIHWALETCWFVWPMINEDEWPCKRDKGGSDELATHVE